MHHRHLELGALMVESEGWLRPGRYTSVEQGPEQVRRAVGLCDISPTGKLSLQGGELDSSISGAFGDDGPLDVGAVRRRGLGNEPAVLARLVSDELMVLTEPGQSSLVADAPGERDERCAHVVDVTSAFAGVAITGPSAGVLLAGVTQLNISPDAFPNMSCAQAGFAEVHGTLLRLDLGDVLSYELYFARELGEYMWDALLDAGERYDVIPFGLEALNRLKEEG